MTGRSWIGVVCVGIALVVGFDWRYSEIPFSQELQLVGGSSGELCDGLGSCTQCVPPVCNAVLNSGYGTYRCACTGGTNGCVNGNPYKFCTPNTGTLCTPNGAGVACGGAAAFANLPAGNIGSTTVNMQKTWYCTDAAGKQTTSGTCAAGGAQPCFSCT